MRPLACLVASALFALPVSAAAQGNPNPPASGTPAPKPPANGAPAKAPAQKPQPKSDQGQAAAPDNGAAGAPNAPASDQTGEAAPTEPSTGAAAGEAGTANPPLQPAPETSAQLPPVLPAPSADARALRDMGKERERKEANDSAGVFAEDWWTKARPIFEIHGYYRLRAELFHNFALGRADAPGTGLWPQPADNFYTPSNGSGIGPSICTPDEIGASNDDNPSHGTQHCKNNTQAGANMRFRLNPELHISDNLRVMSQIDLLDNLVLGSTPEGYANVPSGAGYAVSGRNGYAPIGALDSTQVPPRAGINSLQDSISVKRAWAEYVTPVGELRFGRMPDHWGLGIVANSGDQFDDDYGTTVDRIEFVTGIRPLDLYAGGAWDFANEGATSQTLGQTGGQPYDLSQLDDVDEYVLMLYRKKSPELRDLSLSRGDLVVNGGMRLTWRKQVLANDQSGSQGDCQGSGAAALGCPSSNVSTGYVRRDLSMWIPDLWLQVLYRRFRFELEAVSVLGSLGNRLTAGNDYLASPGRNGYKLAEYGIATELEQRLVEDKLKLGFNFGWASGDPDSNSLVPTSNDPLLAQSGDGTISTFRFNPAYRVDLILHRNLLTRVQGTYYFRPSVEYDFLRDADGQRFGGGAAAIWTRASEFVQTPGHRRDLGVELDGTLYFQSKDGALNDRLGVPGGLYTMLQYGVMFPLGGLKYQDQDPAGAGFSASTPQILRWYLGVLF